MTKQQKKALMRQLVADFSGKNLKKDFFTTKWPYLRNVCSQLN